MEHPAPDSDDRIDAPISRRASMSLLGLAGLGVLSGVCSAQPAGPANAPFSSWRHDVDAQGHDLANLGALVGAGSVSTAANPVPITDFAGANLEIDDGVLNAVLPTSTGGLPFVHDGSIAATTTTDVTYTLSGGPYTRVWIVVESVSFTPPVTPAAVEPSPTDPGYEFALTGVNGASFLDGDLVFTGGNSVHLLPFPVFVHRPQDEPRSGVITMAGRWHQPTPGGWFGTIDFGPDALTPGARTRDVPSPLQSFTFSVVGEPDRATPELESYPFDLRAEVYAY